MDIYKLLNIPESCFIGHTVFKKLFYENADLSGSDKTLFTDVINKITWIYCLKPETINIAPFKDQVRDYPEIEVLEVDLNKNYKLKRIAEIIMRTIPYPILLIFKWESKVLLYVAHQRINQNDMSKNTIDEFIFTDWLDSDSILFAKLNIMQMRFTNFFTLYSDIVDTISVYKVADLIANNASMTGADARTLYAQIEELERSISSLRVKIKKESQFNRRMELNIHIRMLVKKKNKLLGGETR